MRRCRKLVWFPRGPLGIALFVALLAAMLALAIALSAVLLVLAIAAVAALAAAQAARSFESGVRTRFTARPVRPRGGARLAARAERPLEVYLAAVEEFDHLVRQTVRLDPEQNTAWRTRRRAQRLAAHAGALHETANAIERRLAGEVSAERVRPGLWELIVASAELRRYLEDVRAFPLARGLEAQLGELHGLRERAADLECRRDALVRRLAATDLRRCGPASDAQRG